MEYIEGHIASGLKTGDRVKIVNIEGVCSIGEWDSWVNTWQDEMNKFKGKEGLIVFDAGKRGFTVHFDLPFNETNGRSVFSYPYFCLQKIEKEKKMKKKPKKNRTGIIITGEKVFERGVAGVRIKKVKALTQKELPKQYFQDIPHCYLANTEFKDKKLIIDNNYRHVLAEGCFYELQNFNEKLTLIKCAGKRLQEINEKIKEEKKKWNGKIEIHI